MKAVVFTLGCKVNSCESDSLIKGLEKRGYEVSSELCFADLYIVNTCAVTAEAERKSRQTISRINRYNPEAKIIFTGCAAEHSPESFFGRKNVTLVTGTKAKSKILDMLDKEGVYIDKEQTCFDELDLPEQTRTRTFIKVQDGCDNFCSYCLIPYLRGRERSRNPESILKEISLCTAKEVVINGINVSNYNFDGMDLGGLLEKLKGVEKRIRLGSLEVNVITEDFLQATKELYDFAPHFHLSLQSASDSVLKRMNRHYTFEEYLKRVELIRSFYPDTAITTDIIAGFPTETEEDFLCSYNGIEKVGFADVHCFPYSPRKGTVSYKMKDLPFEVKKERTDKLLKKALEYKLKYIAEHIGKTEEFLGEEFDGEMTGGYTGNYIRIYVKGDYSGQMLKVKLTEIKGESAIGQIIN